MHDDRDNPASLRLPDALAALPLQSPPRSAWPALEAKLRRVQPAAPRRHRRVAAWAALAAMLVLAALLPRAELFDATSSPSTERTTTTPMAAHAPDPIDTAADRLQLQTLMRDSAQLEEAVAWGANDAVESAPIASLSAALHQRIGRIDHLLARADVDPAARLPLWQERVLRLRQLADLANTQQLLAANGEADADVPVLVF